MARQQLDTIKIYDQLKALEERVIEGTLPPHLVDRTILLSPFEKHKLKEIVKLAQRISSLVDQQTVK